MTSLTNFFVPSTRLEWFEKANLPIRHLPFVSRSRTVSGALYMLIISLMLPLSQRKPPFLERMFLQNNMAGCTMYSALDLVDGYYQLLMRAIDIPLTAVSTPSGMLWGWLVMPQGLSNAPATFNRLVTQLFRPHRGYT